MVARESKVQERVIFLSFSLYIEQFQINCAPPPTREKVAFPDIFLLKLNVSKLCSFAQFLYSSYFFQSTT